MNNRSNKTALLGINILFSLLVVFPQDTLTHKYVRELRVDGVSRLVLSHKKQYFITDSIFVIKGLFYDNSSYSYQFKIKEGQWFMKHEADWKIFFNGREEKCGSWKIEGMDMIIQWEKTYIKDHTDTIYKFTTKPFHDEDNPLITEKQMDDGTTQIIETIFEIFDNINTFYFTSSSGVIAFIGDWGGIHIREDKLYLKDFLERHWLHRY